LDVEVEEPASLHQPVNLLIGSTGRTIDESTNPLINQFRRQQTGCGCKRRFEEADVFLKLQYDCLLPLYFVSGRIDRLQRDELGACAGQTFQSVIED